MSFRAVVLGLLLAVAVVGLDCISRQLWRLPPLAENHMPRGVFSLVIAGVLLFNPLLGRLLPGRRLRGAELAVIITLALVSGGLTGNALLWHFPSVLALPAHYNLQAPGWRKHNLMSYVPPAALPANGQYDSKALSLIEGMGSPDRPIGLGDVPWAQWSGPLSLWLPLLTLMAMAVICLSLIVHQQWSHHERLRYPIADFVGGVIAESPTGSLPAIMRSRLFWFGVAVPIGLHLINGLNAWFPKFGVGAIPLDFDFSAILNRFPDLKASAWIDFIAHPSLVLMAVAFSYFLASDVGFTLGFANVLFAITVDLIFVNVGVDIRTQGSEMGGDLSVCTRFGASVAMGLMLLYIGRRYYWGAVRRAVGLRVDSHVDPAVGWAVRGLVITVGVMVWMLVAQGLPWLMALLAVGIVLLLYLIVARVNAETGMYWFRISIMPAGLMLALFGKLSMGPSAILLLGIMSALMSNRSESCFMPFVVNGLRIVDDAGISPSRTARAIAPTFVLCLAVSIPIALWMGYNFGAKDMGTWENDRLPTAAFKLADSVVTDLQLKGELEQSERMGSWERIREMKPSKQLITGSVCGFAAVIALSVLRLRLPWWPLHPALMVFWGTWPIAYLGPSFMLGWLIKIAVTRLGRAQAYRGGKHVMIGVIAGDLLSTFLCNFIAFTYTQITRLPPLYTPRS